MARRGWIIGLLLLLVGLIGLRPVSAHATLVRANPSPGSVVDQSPAEIRLWFTEPLERSFSKIILRDGSGQIVRAPASQVDQRDQLQMALSVGSLPDGLYTVTWRALSAADGHPSEGSFNFILGDSASAMAAASQVREVIPPDSALIRWANLISLALSVGSLGFWLFVWSPAVGEPQPVIERRMLALIWLGWLLMGITGVLLLMLQMALASGVPLLDSISDPALGALIAETRFGHLWLARSALWLGLGGALWFAHGDRWFYWIALVIGGGVLAINSVFSHAAGAQDTAVAVISDWLHLTATALWIGGLMQFANVIGPARRLFSPAAPTLARLVAHFTNFARVAVGALILTGLYAAWLQVGSVEGLLTTVYGQALLVKLLLFVPVLGLAAVNLRYTSKHLNAGQEIWGRRLRQLVGAEIALTVGVLAAVGIMTAIRPARLTLADRAANPPPPTPQPIAETLSSSDLTAQLQISPGWVGQNTFTLTLTSGGQPVTNASLVRMFFESQEQNLGETELRPTHQADGVYTVSGENLSVPGTWRIRVNVQRPNQFDTLVDFKPTLPLAPTSPPQPVVDPNAPLPNRVPVLLAAGVLALALGGFFMVENWLHLRRASFWLSVGLLLLSGVFLVSGVQAMNAPPPGALASDAPVRIVAPSSGTTPYIVTVGGTILRPVEGGWWQPISLDAKVRDAYVDLQNTVWAATDAGLFALKAGVWQKLDDKPASRLELMHGYMFAMGAGTVTRAPGGGSDLEKPRALSIPLKDKPASEFVMLGNHSHVLQIGDQVFRTSDLGLSWEPLNAPVKIERIWLDSDGNLLGITAEGILTWNYVNKTWEQTMPLPGGQKDAILRVFNKKLYALAGGQVYRWELGVWQAIKLPDVPFMRLVDIAPQYPDTLWVLDAEGGRLWSSTNAENWAMTLVRVKDV